MFSNTRDRKKPTFSFPGNHRGIVVDNIDPKEAGRIKVKIFGVFDEIKDEDLPWAIMADPLMGGLANNGGSFIPDIGAHVWCFFENADHRFPVYFAGAPAIQDETPDLPEESRAEESYPDNKVFRTTNGIVIQLNNKVDSETIKIQHPTGSSIELDFEGNVLVNSAKNFNLTVTENQTMTVEGDLTVNVTGDTTVSSEGAVEIATDGDALISAGGNADIEAGGDATIAATGNLNAEAGGNAVISAAMIQMN